MMTEIVDGLEEKDLRMQKLKKLKDDIAEILELRDLNDEEALQRISPDNQILEELELDNQEELFTKL
jgi:hypothetical protein